MNIDQLRLNFSDETTCRAFFESFIWPQGRRCPHCGHGKSYRIKSVRPGMYECGRCKRQFTVTTKTPMHSTKLPLWKWLQAMYYILNSSKGISSVGSVKNLSHFCAVTMRLSSDFLFFDHFAQLFHIQIFSGSPSGTGYVP